MRMTPFRANCRLAMLALLLFASLLPMAVTRAQPPTPTLTPASEPQNSSAAQPYAAEVLDPNAAPVVEPEQEPADDAATEVPVAGPANGPAVAPAPDALPQGTPTLLDPAAAEGVAPMAEPKQGVVTLDVSAPVTIRPSERIYYTYHYRNTDTTITASNVILDLTWSGFTQASTTSAWQFCDPSPCAAETLQGPAVTVEGVITSGVRFRVGDLPAGQTGEFRVQLGIGASINPKTNQPPTRPAGSAVLYGNGSGISISEDTANTLVVGPVIALTKTTDTTQKIYTGETAEFTIRVGNATGSGDTVGGQVRGDARLATSLIVKDTFPTGGEFVSATGNPVVDLAAKTVTWTLPGALDVGQTVELRVVFRKMDLNLDCTSLANLSLIHI